jgi:hypothetical protein
LKDLYVFYCIFLSDNFAIEAKTCASSAASIGNAVTLATSIPLLSSNNFTYSVAIASRISKPYSQIINETNL